MKILVVYNVVDKLEQGSDDDLFAEQEIVLVERDIEKALQEHGHTTAAVPINDDLWGPLKEYDPSEWFIFNLCESIRNKTYLEPYIISVFEHLGFRYTGSDRRTLAKCLNKARAKEVLKAHGIPTAAYQILTPWNIQRQLEFPLFVKPISEDASIGITLDSVVHDDRSLRRQVRFIWEMYHQPALVEEFVEGREFNVTLLGDESPRVLPLSEINFRRIQNPFARIVSFRAKWVPNSDEYLGTPPTCPARVSDAVKGRIEDVARRAYMAMGLQDYGRVDLRVKNGTPYVLEVNPNADLSADAGIARAARVAGMTYGDLADEIVRLAARRSRTKGFARPRIVSYELRARSVGADGVYSIPVSALAPASERSTRIKRAPAQVAGVAAA
ncbi:MAG: ATP-grasp domain-containing protein [Chloroflexi bacterium]|nr:ATP-grasp domain-containing protein [Chloroflexota bacterium]